MALKDLLVHVDDSKANAGRVDAAMRLAVAHEAHLTGLYVLPRVESVPAFVDSHIPKEFLEARRKADLARADRAEQEFRAAADRAGVSVEWRFVEGDLVTTLSLHARYVDLLVVGQADPSDTRSSTPEVVDDVVYDVGRPVLVIPYIGAPDTVGNHILVAWNASREAMRAIHDAMPLLERAQAVQVLSVNPVRESARHGELPGADISLHLARHGVDARAAFIQSEDTSVGEMLLSRAADQQADLIVMGAYGHSRYRELVLGGATRELLEAMTVPVLMSH